MSLQRIEKIRCYAKPCKSHFQLLSSKGGFHPVAPRRLHSETLIRQNNLISPIHGVHQNQTSRIQSLCKSFDLSCAPNLPPFGNLSKDEQKKEVPYPMPAKKEPCKRCTKIRNKVKEFFSTKFISGNADETEERSRTIPMYIHKDEQDRITLIPEFDNNKPAAISKPHTIANTIACFGCDEPKREPSIRGPPIISPVCHVSASPTGEVYKNFPDRPKKVDKIDRPSSLGLKRVPNKDQPRETSVHEVQKPKR